MLTLQFFSCSPISYSLSEWFFCCKTGRYATDIKICCFRVKLWCKQKICEIQPRVRNGEQQKNKDHFWNVPKEQNRRFSKSNFAVTKERIFEGKGGSDLCVSHCPCVKQVTSASCAKWLALGIICKSRAASLVEVFRVQVWKIYCMCTPTQLDSFVRPWQAGRTEYARQWFES